MSDMDSECDDVFAEDSKSFSTDTKNEPEEDGRHLMNRKRRRGVIEKRRRDRINNSLSELRRLVPAAFEKQGSAKLEKAEILQMTVDHLKLMHSRGLDVFNLEPQSLVTDYHGLGFRECASEVARYLVSYEGLDLQDPLKMRLMSHLQCFTAHPSAHWFTSLPHFSSSSSSTASRSSISEYSTTSSSSRLSSDSIMMLSVGSPRMTSRLPISPIPSYSRPLKPYRPWGGTELAY